MTAPTHVVTRELHGRTCVGIPRHHESRTPNERVIHNLYAHIPEEVLHHPCAHPFLLALLLPSVFALKAPPAGVGAPKLGGRLPQPPQRAFPFAITSHPMVGASRRPEGLKALSFPEHAARAWSRLAIARSIRNNKPAIAQLVEHLTVECCSNQMVPGSIPGGRI